MTMSAREFRDDDAGYLAWLAAHPDGYVINIARSQSATEARVHHAGCRASGIRDVPDFPTILLGWEEIVGTFTYKDGRRKTLTNGFGGAPIPAVAALPKCSTRRRRPQGGRRAANLIAQKFALTTRDCAAPETI